MHDTALEFGELFFDTYLRDVQQPRIVDVGAQDLNGSLRRFAPEGSVYTGIDFSPGKGVDLVLDDPYHFPFDDESFDVCLSSSCLEHAEFFWLSILEMFRVLKPEGLLFLNVPTNGSYHRFPVDCWRFFPDSGEALARWGRRQGYACGLLESFVGQSRSDVWNDFICVFVKDTRFQERYPKRMFKIARDSFNGRLAEHLDVLRHKTDW